MEAPRVSSASFIEALGGVGVRISGDAALLSEFQADESGRKGARPLAIVYPSDTEQLRQVVQLAASHETRLIPVSSAAGPRRRGDTISDTPAVVVDLSGMSRVINVDGRDAIALIEVGVTFARFAAALKPHGLRPYQPLQPRAAKSVVAAFLEREPTTVPGKHWDSADPLGGMEAVFGSGDIFRTGGASMPGKIEDSLAIGNRQMYSLGPSHTDFGRVLQGSQGALGIVAWASVYCQPIPALEVPLFATSDQLEKLIELCYRLLRRRIEGQLFLVNAMQLALILAADGHEFESLKRSLPAWTVYLELTAPDYFPEESIAYQRALLDADVAELGVSLAPELAGMSGAHMAAVLRDYPEKPRSAQLGMAVQEVFFLSQLDRLPMHINAVAEFGKDRDCAIYIQPMVHGVNAHCQFSYLAPASQADDLVKLARSVAQRCAETGGFFSRPYHPWADIPFARDPHIVPLLKKAKNMLDPHGVLQPGALSLGAAA